MMRIVMREIPPPPPPRASGMTGRLVRAARLCAVLAAPLLALVAAPAAAQVTVSITSTPANGTHYVAGEAIVVRLGGLSGGVANVHGGAFNDGRMSLNIGGVTRQAGTVLTISNHTQTFVDFTYTVTADDFDTDGVSIPANSISGPTWTDIGSNAINRNHAALPAQPAHKVIGSAASISSTSPAILHENNLNAATVTVALTGVTFGSGVTASSFELVTTMTGVTVNSVSSVSSGDTSATLTLASTADISAAANLAVRVLAAAHTGGTALTTGTVPVAWLPELDFGPGSSASPVYDMAVEEGYAGFYRIEPNIDPGAGCTGGVTVGIASDNPAVTVSPAQFSFTSTNWSSTSVLVTATAVEDDNVVDETVTISHTVTTGCAGTYPTTLAIFSVRMAVDDDDTGIFSIDSPRVVEGDSGPTPMTFTVTLAPPASVQATVDYAYAMSGSATAGVDHAAIPSGTLTFAPGETSKTISATVNGDTDMEPDEGIGLQLSNPAPSGFALAQLSGRLANGLIVDDDRPTLTIDSPRVAEGDSGTTQLVFTVRLSPASTGQVTVDWSTPGGTATSGTDYTGGSGTLTFAAGETSKTIAVAVRGDSTVEPDETVELSIFDPVPSGTPIRNADGAIVAFATGVGTIADDDGTVEEEEEQGGGGGPLAPLSDPGLRRAVEQALGKAPGSVTEADLRGLTSLSVDGFGVASLAGLEAASNLEWLTLSGNAPAAGGEPLDLSPLAGLPSLTYLDLSDNALVDVSGLSRLTGLRTLLLGGNAIRDLSSLSGLTGLEALTLSGNSFDDISALSTLTALEQLWLDGNDLSDISALSALGALIYLHLGDNRIADISPLAGLSALRRLWLPNNMVADVSALAGLRALTRLDLSRNRIADASPLRGLPRLSWLRLGWNRLADVSRLAGHPRLADGGALGLRGNPLGAAALDTHIPALREAGAAVVFGWAVPLFPSAADASGRSGVVRVLNRTDRDGAVLVEAVDEAGQMSGPATLSLAAGAAAQFDSADLENGNAEMGLAEGIGPPTRGSWRLLLWSALDIEVLAYMRTPDGFLTAAHAELPRTGDSLSAFLFNPASNRVQRSSLRVFNPGAESARMSVWGVDDAGRGRFASGFMAPPNAPLVLRAGQLERSRGAAGSGLSNGAGKWRLRVHAPWPLSASTFLESSSGHLSNLSSPPLRAAAGEMLRLPLFPSATNSAGREGFARVANMTATDGMVDIEAVDDAGVRAGPVRLQLAARATMHFNSDDLENGNAKKGLAAGVGAPTKGAWRLELQSSDLPLAAATYARHADGFVTSLHETAPVADGAARVAAFHPASSDEQRSLLRLANNGDEPAMATITGVDDAGAASKPLTVTVPAGEALTLTAAQLEDGGEGLEGALGDGHGKWRLTVAFDNPLTVMSLLESPAGHLSNLSATARP